MDGHDCINALCERAENSDYGVHVHVRYWIINNLCELNARYLAAENILEQMENKYLLASLT